MQSLNFKQFLESSKFSEDIEQTLSKIPAGHRTLVKGYKFKVEGDNTLKKDKKSVGEIDEKKKTMTIAAPYFYGREFVVLHEIAHSVWKYIMTPDLKKGWSAVVKKSKKLDDKKLDQSALDQNEEELFCSSYAAAYTKNPPIVFYQKPWMDFIRNLPS